ncbi:hypothetical protein NI17_005555 [Thermobifida halotolerans]|uniref:DDE Tnp4 domain-containing protein n=1 Tax=Thermobifida halotolerans TaxID=483545 RepID=A0AA97M2F1_9ACTN|nr:hypothetical protein [Thermobifida halotolerans]UOE22246.1 hypothetical protein NI17_005555 [Thermobifida halotolerans]
MWASHALLAVHDTRAARIRRLAERIQTAGLLGLADKGYDGLAPGVVLCPSKGRTSHGRRRTPAPPTPHSALLASGPSPN